MNLVWLLSGALGGIGLLGLVYKKTMLGLIVSIQVLVLGCCGLFVLAGSESGMRVDGHSFAIFIIMGGIAQTVGGYALATRMFYLKSGTTVTELRNLRR